MPQKHFPDASVPCHSPPDLNVWQSFYFPHHCPRTSQKQFIYADDFRRAGGVKNRPTDSGAERKKFVFLHLQRPCQKNYFRIRHATDLRLNFGNRVLANVPSDAGTTRRQHGLSPALAVADFSHDWTDNVLRNRLAHDLLLTVCERGLLFLPFSEGTCNVGKNVKPSSPGLATGGGKILSNGWERPREEESAHRRKIKGSGIYCF